jgi:hypothetical protein
MSNIGVFTKNLVDIGTIFRPYRTGSDKASNHFFTKNSVDIGDLLQKYESGATIVTGLFTRTGVDIGTLFQSAYATGLTVRLYTGEASTNVTYDNGQTPYYTFTGITNTTNVNTTTNGQIAISGASNFTVVLTGFLLSDFTGTWTIGSTSDDKSYIWIGPNALSGYTTSNATLANDWSTYTLTTTVSLVSGVYYPFRLIYSQGGGPYNLTFFYNRNGSGNTYDWSGKFFS